MTKKAPSLTEQLRQAINDCGVSRYRISKDTGIHQTVLEKFVNGKRGISVQTLDLLGEYLQLELKRR